MCRDLGNKNDGKIFKTLGKNWINCGNRGNYRKCFKNIFLIVKIKDVGKRSPHHYCCIMHGWHYISMHNIFWFCQKLSWGRGLLYCLYEHKSIQVYMFEQ
jgi:hypothetical protein